MNAAQHQERADHCFAMAARFPEGSIARAQYLATARWNAKRAASLRKLLG